MEAEERLIEHLRDRQLAAPREGMGVVRNDHARLDPECLDMNPKIDQRWMTERRVHVFKPGHGRSAR